MSDSPLKITITVNGRFHAFDLAAQLQQHGVLHQLITAYPQSIAQQWGIANDKVTSLWLTEIFKRAILFIPIRRLQKWLQYWQHRWFDRWASRHLPPDTDIVIAWGSSALATLQRAKTQGMHTILECGSCHVLKQLQLLHQAYADARVPFYAHHDKITQMYLHEYRIVDRIAIPSDFVKNSFVEQPGMADKLMLNPYGVNLTHFQPSTKKDRVFRIIHVGSLCIRKGSHLLLQAMDQLRHLPIELWHVGRIDPEMRPILTPFKNNPRIRFWGTQPQKKLAYYYAQSSILCLPSIEEGLSMVILQAMACGVPAIVSENSGGCEIIISGENGFIIPAGALNALRQQILYCYNYRRTLTSISVAAKATIADGWRWADYGQRAIKHYQNLASTTHKDS